MMKAPPTAKIDLKGMPRGDYSKLSFFIGVDRVLNHSGGQEGLLDPDYNYGMFWMWETGYVFFKMEGFYQSKGEKKGVLCSMLAGTIVTEQLTWTLPPIGRKFRRV